MRGVEESLIQGLDRNVTAGWLDCRNNMIFRVEAHRKANDALPFSRCGDSYFHQIGNPVEIDVALERGRCHWGRVRATVWQPTTPDARIV
jgi:hypothetical protein